MRSLSLNILKNVYLPKLLLVTYATLLWVFIIIPTEVAYAALDCNDSDKIRKAISQLSPSNQDIFESLVQCGSTVVPHALQAINEPDLEISLGAMELLYFVRGVPKSAALPISSILANSTKDDALRSSAARLLETIGSDDEVVFTILLRSASDSTNNESVRLSSISALGTSRKGDTKALEAFSSFLTADNSEEIRIQAAHSIRKSAAHNEEEARKILYSRLVEIIKNPSENEVLVSNCISAMTEIIVGDDTTIDLLLSTVERSDQQVSFASAIALLEAFKQARIDREREYNTPYYTQAAEEALLKVKKLPIRAEPPLRKVEAELNGIVAELSGKSSSSSTIRRFLIGDRAFWILHPLVWIGLIFAYPKSPQIQAIFFWNSKVRAVLGCWYVGSALTLIPFLRRRLFAPFKDSLLADAQLDSFSESIYFPDAIVKVRDRELPISSCLSEVKGQVILEGKSGLGKTMLLRHLTNNSKRLLVYLPAQKCQSGVISAIQAKLHGQAQDEIFLKKLIYSGALDIYIDGLNEVQVEVRSSIVAFVESFFKGNIIITTQPMVWTPPSTAKLYELQPLPEERIHQFLRLYGKRLPPGSPVIDDDYNVICDNFLKSTLHTPRSKTEYTLSREILSNPMDLSIISQILGKGHQPNLFSLQQQQYELMILDYQSSWNQAFPLNKFASFVYKMRLADSTELTGESFDKVLSIMEKEQHRMVISRQWKNPQGEERKEWTFRHAKIMEFFLLRVFLESSRESEKRRKAHIDDPRFREVYLSLAQVLPIEEALKLQQELVQRAAQLKDTNLNHLLNDYTLITMAREEGMVV